MPRIIAHRRNGWIMSRGTSTIVTLAALMAALLISRLSQGQSQGGDRLTVLKAGMVLNFVKYTEWPSDVFESADGPIVITVVGRCALTDVLARAVQGQEIGGRRVSVMQVNYPEFEPGRDNSNDERLREFQSRLHRSHVVYVCEQEASRVKQIIALLQGAAVLTVSDAPRFAERGGMLGLVVREGRLAFDANAEAIRQTRLKVSYKVLRLARIVETTED